MKKSEPYGKGTYVSYCELEAEPIDSIVLERQDRGVDGSQVKEKKWERLATKIYGRVRLTEQFYDKCLMKNRESAWA